MSVTEKRLLLVLGSPRRHGNTEILAETLGESAQRSGFSVHTVHLAGMNLKGCIDCRKCWTTGAPCVQRDDMEQVYAELIPASVVAFASPLYFYSWSSQIKPVWDRLLPFYTPKSPHDFRGKGTILLSAAGDSDPSAFDGLKLSFKHSTNYLGWRILGEICATDVYPAGEIKEKGDWLERAKTLGSCLS